MLIKHYINGKIKDKEEQAIHCETCKDGEVFEHEKCIKTQKHEDKIKEFICQKCTSKYIVPAKVADKLIDKECDECPYLSEDKCGDTNMDFLCIGNTDNFAKRLFDEEVNKVGLDLIAEREIYDQLGICNHNWIKSKPFITSEGKFEIDNCLICKQAQVDYFGTVIKGNVMELVTKLLV